MKHSKNGRPTKFNAKIADAIVKDIADHVPYKIAAQANGICERTLYYWMDRGLSDMENDLQSDYRHFLQSLRVIEVNKIKQHISKIETTEKGHKGSQWILEHVFWRYFSSSVATIELNERLEKLERTQN